MIRTSDRRRGHRRKLHSGLLWAVLLVTRDVVPGVSAAPVTFNTALPVSRGEIVVRAQAQYMRATDDPGPLNRELTMTAVPLVGAYGVTSRWTLFGMAPWVDKRLALTSPPGRVTREASGLGDITVMARYTAYARDAPGRTLRVAPFAGVEVPAGSDNRRDGLGVLPRPLQPGSGSWDPLFGAVITDQSLGREWGADASYKFNGEADGFQFGDEARLDLSYHKCIAAAGPAGCVPHLVYAGLEGNLVWQGKNRSGGVNDPDSGGTTLYVAPTLQYVTRRIIAEGAIQVPAMQNLNGNALKADFTAILGLRMNF